MGATTRRQPPRQVTQDVEDDDAIYETRLPTSTRRYNRPPERDTLGDSEIQKNGFVQRRSRPHPHPAHGIASNAISVPTRDVEDESRRFPWMAVLIGMIVMALLAIGITMFGSWWRVHQDDAQYGRPRTYQFDAVVGHNDSQSNKTHFICLNLNRHVEIIEFPGGDATHAHIYIGPTLFGDGQDLTPVTAETRDVNGDGRPDLIVHIQDQQVVFINDGTTFRPLQQGEHVNLP